MDFAANTVAYFKRRKRVLKNAAEQSDRNGDLANVSILLTVALCIGVYLIATTAIIAKDGVTFIKYSQQLEDHPVKTMMNESQHPGYPWLILMAHKATAVVHKNTSILSWIYSAQGAALIFRLLAIIILYFIGKHLFGAGTSFWAVLILILLPKPAEYGSDALSDWPHLCLLAVGMLLLFKGAAKKSWWMFGIAGLAAGAGYLIRPECAVVIAAGGLWLGLQLVLPQCTMNKSRALSALALLLAGFLIIAGPYMSLKGAVFPKKSIGRFAINSKQPEINAENSQAAQASPFTLSNIAKAFGKLFENTGETLMWFFVPALFIGMYKWLKTRKWPEPERFFVTTVIVLYVPVMIWLYCRHGYTSYRHTLPLLIIPILYVPVGLQGLASWCHKRFSGKAESSAAANSNERFWFFVLLIIGVSICAAKLFGSVRAEKQGYRAAAQWLKANTNPAEIVAEPDPRISFYAERRGLLYENAAAPENAEYLVQILKKGDNQASRPAQYGNAVYECPVGKKGEGNVIIYRKM